MAEGLCGDKQIRGKHCLSFQKIRKKRHTEGKVAKKVDEESFRKGKIQKPEVLSLTPTLTQERAHELSEHGFNYKSPKSLSKSASCLCDKHYD